MNDTFKLIAALWIRFDMERDQVDLTPLIEKSGTKVLIPIIHSEQRLINVILNLIIIAMTSFLLLKKVSF